ncbi:MAG TPA: carboxypeptidase regulatory-like domain-containing protein [Thermoanaerobaculia bacterium]
MHGSVLVHAPGAARRGSVRPILLPDFEVTLREPGTGEVAATRRTDLFGRYMFPPLPAGTYELAWERQRGWAAGRHPDPVVVTGDTQYPRPVELHPEKGHGVVSGRVRLADGGSPWYASPYFDVERYARVATEGEGVEATAVRANFAGDYALAVPASRAVRVRAESGDGKAAGPVASAAVGQERAFAALDLRVENRRPVLDAVVSRQNGEPTRHAPPGATVQLAALVRDPDGDRLRYAWKTDSGQLGDGEATVAWSLPSRPGAYTAYVLVSDGRGGDVQGKVTVAVGARGDTFSGRVVGAGGKPVAEARVTVGGKVGTTDARGVFNLVVPPARRYVLNVSSPGYVPLSRLFDRPSNGHVWRLVPAQVTQVDPRRAIELVDRRPDLARRQLQGASVRIPAGALVDATGRRPSGTLTATFATLDLAADEAPGDWIARDDGDEVGLVSYGLASVSLTDAAGTSFNLAPGATAEVTIPIPPGMVANAPPEMPIWTYDEKDGYWKPLGTATLDPATGSYKGKVPHFSFINMDQPGPVACLRVHSDVSIPTGLKLRVADVPGQGVEYATVKEVVLDGPLNAVYRLPANSLARLTVLDAAGTVLPNVILEDGNTTGAIGVPLPGNEVDPGAANPDLWPPSPYASCKPVTLKLDALWAGYPGSPFLTFKDFGADATSSAAYYAAVDPMNLRTDLAGWWSQNGFDASGNAPAGPNYARTSYLNNNDLGSGRDMHFLRHADGRLSAYVTNYSRGGPFDQNPVFADDALADNQPGATVCMEYAPVEGDPSATMIVKFFVYAGAGETRQAAADLDGFGARFVPNLCLNCHGGSYYNPPAPSLAELNMGSSFRELDIATYRFPGFRVTANAAEQADFKKQNQMITATGAARLPIAQLIDGWYAPGGTGLTQDNSYTPTAWSGAPQEGLYHDVVKVSCRTCHIAFVSGDDAGGIDWNRYDQLRPRRNDVRDLVIGPSISDTAARLMPHALVTYRNFWIDQVPAHRAAQLWNYADPNPPGWVAIGAPPP